MLGRTGGSLQLRAEKEERTGSGFGEARAWARWVHGDPSLVGVLQRSSWRTEVRGWLVSDAGTSEHVCHPRG